MEFLSLLNVSKTVGYFDACNEFPSVLLLWRVSTVLFFILGFPASLMEIWELFQRLRQRNANDFLMLSMAAIDVSLTSSLIVDVLNFNIWQNLEVDYINSFIYCLALSGRPLFMACVCTDCYFAVVHPISYKTCKKSHTVRSVVVWNISLCTSALFLALGYNTLVPCISLFTALPIILFCDTCTLQVLTKPDPSGRSKVHPQKKRALHIISSSLIMSCLVYLPPGILFLFENVMSDVTFDCISLNSAFCFSIFGCVIMPILYLNNMGKLDTFKQCCKK